MNLVTIGNMVLIVFEICLYIISKNSQRHRKFDTLLSNIRPLILHMPSQIQPMAITNSTLDHSISNDLSSTCYQKTYSKDVENLMFIKEIGRYITFHHCNPTHPYFTSDVIRFCRHILGSNPIMCHGH